VKTTLTRWRRTPESKIRRCEHRRIRRRDSRQIYKTWHAAVKSQSVEEAARSYGSRGPHKTTLDSHLEPSCGNTTTSQLVKALKQQHPQILIRHHRNSKFMNKHFKPTILKHNQFSSTQQQTIQQQQQQQNETPPTPSQSSQRHIHKSTNSNYQAEQSTYSIPTPKQTRTEWFKSHITDPTPHNRQQHDIQHPANEK
jgi:hypothetical protein